MAGSNIVGERIRLARRTAKPPVSQDALAARLQTQGFKLEQAAISKIETGRRTVSAVEAAAMARALGVSVGWLFGECQAPKQR